MLNLKVCTNSVQKKKKGGERKNVKRKWFKGKIFYYVNIEI